MRRWEGWVGGALGDALEDVLGFSPRGDPWVVPLDVRW